MTTEEHSFFLFILAPLQIQHIFTQVSYIQ